MATLGSLVVELSADVGRLASDMGRAVSTVNSASSRMLAFAKRTAGALGAAFAGVSFASSIRDSINAADGLRDLSRATGQTVEQLSFLQYAAGQSGTSVDAIARASQRLARSLLDVASGKGEKAADALRRLGLSADTLAQQDLAGQISTIGEALVKIDNPSQRAAIGIALFGKQYQQLAPLILEGRDGLAGLADEFIRLNGATTGGFADKADAFNDALGRLKLASDAAGRAIAEQLAPALTAMFDVLAKTITPAQRPTFGFFDGLIERLSKAGIAAAEFDAKFSRGVGELFNSDRYRERAAAAETDADEIRRSIRQRRNAARAGRLENDTSAERAALLSGTAAGTLEGTPDPEAGVKAQTALARAARLSGQALRETRRLIDEEAQAWEEVDRVRTDAAQRAETLRRAVETPRERGLRELAEFERTFGQDSEEYGRKAVEVIDELYPSLEAATDATLALERAGEDLGLTFASAFEDAVVNGAKLSEVLKGIGQDILRIGIRKTITNPASDVLKSLFSSAGGGSGIGDFFKGLFGNARGGLYKVGGGSGEHAVAFNARAGEVVAVGRPGGDGGGDGGVTIINNTGMPVGARDRGRVGGRRTIELGVLDAMSGAVASGSASRELGLSPRLAAR